MFSYTAISPATPDRHRILLMFVGLALLSGCTSTLSPLTGHVPLTSETIRDLEGQFSYYGQWANCKGCDPVAFGPEVIDRREHGLIDSVFQSDSTSSFTLRVRDPRHLNVLLSTPDGRQSEWIIKGRIDEEGAFRLSYLMGLGGYSPFIWGILEHNARLVLSNDGSLIVDSAFGGTGFITLIPVFPTTSSARHIFPRVSE